MEKQGVKEKQKECLTAGKTEIFATFEGLLLKCVIWISDPKQESDLIPINKQ